MKLWSFEEKADSEIARQGNFTSDIVPGHTWKLYKYGSMKHIYFRDKQVLPQVHWKIWPSVENTNLINVDMLNLISSTYIITL